MLRNKLAEIENRQRGKVNRVEMCLNNLAEKIWEQDICVKDIDYLYFYVASNYQFCKSFSIGFAFREINEEEYFPNLNSIGKYGTFESRDSAGCFLKMIKSDLIADGYEPIDAFENLEIDCFKICL